jgi:uncharacterized SAM-binding protein YcdF (DUF218 family)
MTSDDLSPEQVKDITERADIDAPPPDGEPTALVVFGTNQAMPAVIAAARYHRGLAPLIIVTGGVNRHDGVVEGREFARLLTAADVPASAIRVEDQSADTWQNVELSLPYLREALAMGLPLTAVSKWYHLRTVYCLRTLLPGAVPFYAIGWEPLYAGVPVTRETWPHIPDGRRRVIRETREVPRRVTDGTYQPVTKSGGAWRLSSLSRVPNACGAPPGPRPGGAPACAGSFSLGGGVSGECLADDGDPGRGLLRDLRDHLRRDGLPRRGLQRQPFLALAG